MECIDFYDVTLEYMLGTGWKEDRLKPTPTHKALATLSRLIRKPIVNRGGDGYILPPLYAVQNDDGSPSYLPRKLSEIKALINQHTAEESANG